jgi:hypothetical protein
LRIEEILMITPFNHEPNCYFLGFPMSQNRYAIPAWSYLFEQVPPKIIVEIGTSVGGMTCLLAIAAREYEATMHTFDISPTMSEKTLETLRRVGGDCVKINVIDVLDAKGSSLINAILRLPGQSILLCDGGNKVLEFRTFAKSLKPGDVIAAHDFGAKEAWPWQEVRLEDVIEVMGQEDIVPFMEDVFANTGWLVCRKKIAI